MAAGNTGGRSFGSGGSIVDDAAFASLVDELATETASAPVALTDAAVAAAGDLAAFLAALLVAPVVVAARANVRSARAYPRGSRS